jgi:hypothetical protein
MMKDADPKWNVIDANATKEELEQRILAITTDAIAAAHSAPMNHL